MQRDRIELMLSLAAAALLLLACTAAGFAQLNVQTTNLFNVNRATSAEIASHFHLPFYTAKAVQDIRAKEGGFSSLGFFTEALHKAAGKSVSTPLHWRRYAVVRSAGGQQVQWMLVSLWLAASLVFIPLLARYKLKINSDPFMLPAALLLAGLSVVLLFTLRNPLKSTPLYLHQLAGITAGEICMLLLVRIRSRAWLLLNPLRIGLAALLLYVAVFILGHGPAGVHLSLLGFQPVEITKLLAVLFAAGVVGSMEDPGNEIYELLRNFHISRLRGTAGRSMALYCALLLCFLISRDMGPGLVLFLVLATQLAVSMGEIRILAAGVLVLLPGAWMAYHFHAGFFPVRVDMWLSPFKNSHPQGMQLAQAFWAMSSSGFWGSGLGLGLSHFLPRAQDDLTFAAWAEQTGWPGVMLLLGLITLLTARGLRAAIRAELWQDRAIALGLSALLGIQSVVIVFGVTGLTPLTGLSLPFFAYGNSALLFDFAALAMLLSISATEQKTPFLIPKVRKMTLLTGSMIASALLLLAGVGRMLQLQLFQSSQFAVHVVNTPDRDGKVRAHENPRLLWVAGTIVRGAILDRNGAYLAVSNPAEMRSILPDKTAYRYYLNKGRYYPLGKAASDVVGMNSKMTGGPTGAELKYDILLRGYKTLADLLPYYRNRYMPWYLPPQADNVTLTLDSNVQKSAWHALTAACMKAGTHRGAMVVLQPATGQVLAWVSLPAWSVNHYNSAEMTQLQHSSRHPLVDRVTQGLYPPGSTMKIATAACALQYLPNALQYAVACNKTSVVKWNIGGQTYSRLIHDDVHDPAFGMLTMPRAFEVSSNIYFSHLAVQLNQKVFRNFLISMGFAHIPAAEDFRSDLADIGYGQGKMLATPLEMASITAAVGDFGIRWKPCLLLKVEEVSRHKTPVMHASSLKPVLPGSAYIQQMMRGVVLRGTAAGIFSGLDYPVAGKTGTAQLAAGKKPDSWFVGLAPCNGSDTVPVQYAFACVLENGGYGSTGAGYACFRMLKDMHMQSQGD